MSPRYPHTGGQVDSARGKRGQFTRGLLVTVLQGWRLAAPSPRLPHVTSLSTSGHLTSWAEVAHGATLSELS